jgi:hypothetical protein
MKAVGVMVALVASTAIAKADWEFTRWGMTPDEVIAASQGRAVRVKREQVATCSNVLGRCLVTIPTYTIDRFPFVATFHFDAKEERLAAVQLSTEGVHAAFLEQVLIGTYGTPSTSRTQFVVTHTWLDEKRGNVVVLVPGLRTNIIYTAVAKGF